MAAQIQKGHTYNPGDVVDAADLNALVDSATALAGIITDPAHTAVNATTGDKVLLSRAGVLKQADVSTFPSGVTSVSATATPTSVFGISVATPGTTPAIALSLDNQTAGKVLAGPVSGSAAEPAFRVLSPADMPVATVSIAASVIDWNLGVMFTKTLAANTTFTFTGASAGQTIRVFLIQDGTGTRTVTWPTVRWPGGTNPVMTTGAGTRDLYTFHFIGGLYYGTFDQNFLP